MLTYNHKLKRRVQQLRKSQTKWETKLWYGYLSKYPIRFTRQKPIGNYIVDFYCFAAKLVVELDGSQHYSDNGLEYDKIRTAYLQGLGLNVIRFSDYEITSNFVGVCQRIDDEVKGHVGKTPATNVALPL